MKKNKTYNPRLSTLHSLTEKNSNQKVTTTFDNGLEGLGVSTLNKKEKKKKVVSSEN